MVEVIVTLISNETHDGVTYPTTQLWRLEFDTIEAFRTWKDTADVVAIEKLTA